MRSRYRVMTTNETEVKTTEEENPEIFEKKHPKFVGRITSAQKDYTKRKILGYIAIWELGS